MSIGLGTRRITPTKTQTVVGIYDCYSIKDSLKSLGYRWIAMDKCWEKVTADPIEEITRFFEAGLGTIEDYEKLYTTGVLQAETYDFSDEQFDRIGAVLAPEEA